MATRLTIEWSADALADLDRFAAFLQSTDPRTATIVAREIIAKVDILAVRPSLGKPTGAGGKFRQIILRVLNAPYVMQYRVDENRLVMLRVFHGREHRGSQPQSEVE